MAGWPIFPARQGTCKGRPPVIHPLVNELIPQLIPQAKALAWRTFQRAPHVLERDELESIAYIGLMDAANRWEAYCERNGYSPEAVHYFGAYALRRMRGSVMDFLRASDWATRSARQRAKRLQAAGGGTGMTHAELAAVTGMTVAQVRQTEAAVACKPVSLDEGDRDIPEAQDVEAQAAMRLLLEQVAAVRWRLSPAAQVVLALRYYEGRELAAIAEALGLAVTEVSALHDEGVRAVHGSVLAAVA
jgi:RNA polymerase sigma factor for flagellar operon FliA